MRRCLLAIPVALLGCADLKGEERGLPGDGKLDSLASPTDHGHLPFGVASEARLSAQDAYHVWSFTLSAPATIEGSVDGGELLDTVLYLYKRGPSAWGSHIAYNDDDGRDYLSSIKRELSAGEYRFLVKAYDAEQDGDFTLTAHCEGAGCDGGAPPPPSCALGSAFSDLASSGDWVNVVTSTASSSADLGGITLWQARAALAVAFPDVTDVAQVDAALARVDGGIVRIDALRHDQSNYIASVISFRVGGEIYGAVFEGATTDQLAAIRDGAIGDCTLFL